MDSQNGVPYTKTSGDLPLSTNGAKRSAEERGSGGEVSYVPTPLIAILLLALLLRLIFALGQDPLTPYARGAVDTWWYLANGDALITGRLPTDVIIDVSRLPTPPGYLILLGIAQGLFDPAGAVVAVRVLQSVMGMIICWCGWRLALRLTGRRSAGLLAALILAVSPAFIIEASQLVTESLYIFLLGLGLVAYVEGLPPTKGEPVKLRGLILTGVCFGLAALTRAPILLFPVGLAIHLLIVCGIRAGWRRAVVLLAVYVGVVATWTVYNLARWDRFVIAAEGFASFVYVGATGWDGPQAVDERLGSTDGGATSQEFLDAAAESIGANPMGYIQRRIGELGGAVLQPHGTVYFPGESLRDLAVNWLQADRSLAGLSALIQGDAFFPKLLLYIFHYGALILGIIGMWRSRVNWRVSLVFIGFILYTLLVHLVFLALPRYIFPTMLVWVVYASAAVFLPLSTNGAQRSAVERGLGVEVSLEPISKMPTDAKMKA